MLEPEVSVPVVDSAPVVEGSVPVDEPIPDESEGSSQRQSATMVGMGVPLPCMRK